MTHDHITEAVLGAHRAESGHATPHRGRDGQREDTDTPALATFQLVMA